MYQTLSLAAYQGFEPEKLEIFSIRNLSFNSFVLKTLATFKLQNTMKKLLVLTALILFSGITFSQTLEKGNLLGLHILTIKPNPDVTFNQYMDYFMNKYVPKYEESFPGLKLRVLKGIRGEHENSFGLLIMFDSVETRDKYWPKMDEASSLAQIGFQKMSIATAELAALGSWTSTHTDWVVQ